MMSPSHTHTGNAPACVFACIVRVCVCVYIYLFISNINLIHLRKKQHIVDAAFCLGHGCQSPPFQDTWRHLRRGLLMLMPASS